MKNKINKRIWIKIILVVLMPFIISCTSTNNVEKSEIKKIKSTYTIAANSFLKGTLKTSLLGRIPIDGKVSDPFRFVIEITDRALFASFHSHAELLVGMRVSGFAQGDLLLSCAKGSIDSMTFTFADEGVVQKNGIDLAFIVDEQGQPCINGELKTNAPKAIKPGETNKIIRVKSGTKVVLLTKAEVRIDNHLNDKKPVTKSK